MQIDSRVSDLKNAIAISQKEVIQGKVPLEENVVMYQIQFQAEEQPNCQYEFILKEKVKGGKFKGKELEKLKEEFTAKFGDKINQLNINKYNVRYLNACI